jgi:hypothetical protein
MGTGRLIVGASLATAENGELAWAMWDAAKLSRFAERGIWQTSGTSSGTGALRSPRPRPRRAYSHALSELTQNSTGVAVVEVDAIVKYRPTNRHGIVGHPRQGFL